MSISYHCFYARISVCIGFLKGEKVLMKKGWKYALISLLVLILGAGGTIYYFLNIKTYEITDKEIEEITASEYEIILPEDVEKPADTPEDDSKTETTDNSDKTTENNKTTGENHSTENNGNKGSSTENENGKNENNTPQPNTTEKDKPVEITVASIKGKYRPVFESLEAQANTKIDGLVSRAIGEYHQKKNNGESISFAYFFQKYTSAGKDLESKTDDAFNYIFTALQDNLKKHGFSPNHANEFKEQYENAKKARESALLNKAKEAL
jgi:hypothetical protein